MKFPFLVLFLFPLFSLQGFDIKTLSLEEKVGQVLLVHFHGFIANQPAEELLQKGHVGGFIYFNWSNDLSSPHQVQTLSIGLQRLNETVGNRLPLFLAVDQEGGKVTRLKKGFTEFPSQEILAKTGIKDLGEQVALSIGQELKAVGINFNCAPVVDINSDPKNSVIGSRAFGSIPSEVADWGEKVLQGYEKAGIIAALKHFPGHGDVAIDSHTATPKIQKTKEELEAEELFPFKRLACKADVVMTGHLLVPALDSEHPTTFSRILLTEVLREKLHFNGVILSDSLVMKALSNWAPSYEEAALMALTSGCDLLCLGGKLLNEPSQDEIGVKEILQIHSFLVNAVKEGRYPEELLNESVQRILELKEKRELSSWKSLEPLPLIAQVSTNEHQNLKDEIMLLAEMRSKLTKAKVEEIGKAIWQNESNGQKEGLLFWSPYEEFPSLGIGHFLWYPEGKNRIFEEGFPLYLDFLKKRKISLPSVISQHPSAPWKSREEFLKERNGPLAQEISEWLASTVDQQAAFMLDRMVVALHEILFKSSTEETSFYLKCLQELSQNPASYFALVDYVNFKGTGLSLQERYCGKGWGLKQVLSRMSNLSSSLRIEEHSPLCCFQRAAIDVLNERVSLAPKERQEERWLFGWKNRIASYSRFPNLPID